MFTCRRRVWKLLAALVATPLPLLTALVALPFPVLAAPALTQSDAEAFFDGIMSQRMERDDLAGAAVAIVKDGELLFEKGYGYADVAKKTPVSPDETLFGIASISKTFTGTAVMQLVSAGKLDLDADVSRYLDFEIKRRFSEPITLRRLLTHTAGFEEGGKDDLDATSKLGPFLATHQPAQIFRPGIRIAYSNYGNSLAGYVVERVSGMPYAQYIAENVYKPLGMTHSTFEAPLPPEFAAHASKEYWLASQPPRALEYLGRRPAGGMFSTANDMSKFMLAHLQNGHGILTEDAARTMHTVQWRGTSDRSGIAISFFYQYLANGRLLITHSGDLACQHSDMWLIPQEHVGVFVIFNTTGTDYTRIRGSILQSFVNRYFPPLDPTPPKAVATAHSDALAAAGTYLSTRRAESSILSMTFALQPVKVWANSDDTLSFEPAKYYSGEAKRYVAQGNMVFREPEGHTLAFVRDAKGKTEAMIADGIAEFDVEHSLLSGKAQVLLLLVAISSLIVSALLWPVGALMRWRFQRPLRNELDPAARRRVWIVRAVVFVALAMVVMAGNYLAILSRLEFEVLSGSNDPYIRVFQLMALLVIVGSVYALWRAVLAWRGREGTSVHRLGATFTGCALAILAVFFLSYHILALHLNF